MHTNFTGQASSSKTIKHGGTYTPTATAIPLPGLLTQEHLKRLVAAMVD